MPLSHHTTAATQRSVAAVLLAGGQGTRLGALTANECKPAIHFAGPNRIVDFAMANCVRSGLDRLLVATQYMPQTLHHHLPARWGRHFAPGGLVLADGRNRYRGTADVLRQNAALIGAASPRHVLVLAADHVYDMDYGPLIAGHMASGAALTLAVAKMPRRDAASFGVLETAADGRITAFHEKPSDPPGMQGDGDCSLVSTGIYVFDAEWLNDALFAQRGEALDFGHEIVPRAVDLGLAAAYPLPANRLGQRYWRDVGTLDALRLSQLDFVRNPPAPLPCPAPVCDWHLGRGSVAMSGARVPGSARLSRCIVAPGTRVPAGLVAGEDPEEDARWFHRSPGGTLLITGPMLRRRAALRQPFGRATARPNPADRQRRDSERNAHA